jgi:peptidoglycan/LPS O-acetylase OafA/YrhL
VRNFLGILQRKTTSAGLIPEIDGLRFLAIIIVVLFHLNTAFSKELGLGLVSSLELLGGKNNQFSLGWWWVRLDLGVKVFFAISGFVLALPFLKYYLGLSEYKVQLKSYFVRRLIRLEPPFIINLVTFYLVHVILLNANSYQYLKHLGTGLIYGHVFIYGEANPINPVSWSLETEAQFYIIMPFIMWLIFRFKPRLISLVLFLIAIAGSVWFKHEFMWNAYWNRSILAYFVNFGIGIFACWVYLVKSQWIKEKSYFWDFVSILALIGLFYFYKPQHIIGNILYFNLSLLLVIFSTFKGIVTNWFYTRKWIYTIGGMCYSIYLIHYAFFHLSTKYTKYLFVNDWNYSTNLALQVLISLPLVLLLSSMFFVLFERPFMDRNWVEKLKRKIY